MAEASRLEQANQPAQAEVIYRAIATQLPAWDVPMAKLASIAFRAGRREEALEWLQRASAANPTNVNHLGNLAVVLTELGRFSQAIDTFTAALRLQPDNPHLHGNLGNVFHQMKLYDKALASYHTALSLNPNIPEVWLNAGNTLSELHRFHDAVEAQERALALKPDLPEAWVGLGNAARHAGQMDRAIQAFNRALELRPDLGDAYTGLGAAYHLIGRLREANDHYRRGADITGRPEVADGLLVSLHLDESADPQSLFREHTAWNQKYARPLASEIQPHPTSPDPNRRLRIGYVSAYFNSRPVGRFLTPLFENHDHSAFEIVCYSDLRQGDAVTDSLRARTDLWRDTLILDDAQLASQIRDDRIDILIDLGMHTRGNRMLTFARIPAPVQVTYLAYCSTTGLDTIDYRLSDPFLDPTDDDQPFYSERTIRLNSYWCYPPPDNAAEPGPLPATQTGHITFGCLNDFSKVTNASLEMWGRAMSQTPNSRLILHSYEGGHRAHVLDTFAKHGVDPARIKFVAMQPTAQYFATYHDIDIALDPTPWCGGTTTCDALYMGVPVVTLSSRTAISRGGASILGQLALTQWVAKDPAQYIQIAKDLASNLPKLAQTRRELRDTMRRSRLMDGHAFARDFEDKLRTMWKNWCARQKSGS
jgi:predicted O-linked N-acetylglucosamine transferase (SPINDLY family)